MSEPVVSVENIRTFEGVTRFDISLRYPDVVVESPPRTPTELEVENTRLRARVEELTRNWNRSGRTA